MYPGRRGRYDGVADVDKGPFANDFPDGPPPTARSRAVPAIGTRRSAADLHMPSDPRCDRAGQRSSRIGAARAREGGAWTPSAVATAAPGGTRSGGVTERRSAGSGVGRRTGSAASSPGPSAGRQFLRWSAPSRPGDCGNQGQITQSVQVSRFATPNTSEESIAPGSVRPYSRRVSIPPMNPDRVRTVDVVPPAPLSSVPATPPSPRSTGPADGGRPPVKRERHPLVCNPRPDHLGRHP